jgi:hypothetical protein
MVAPPTIAGPSGPPWAAAAERRSGWTVPAALAAALAVAWFLLQRSNGLDLGDEGFIWYAAKAVSRGEVPLRDFRSYDPGWSYWMAGWFALLGREGFVVVRLATAAALALAFFAILRACVREGLAFAWSLAIGGLWVLWAFDVPAALNGAVGLGVTAAGAALLARPSARRHLLAGAVTGAAAFVGRNHGLYGFCALIALVALAPPSPERPSPGRRVLLPALGVGLGYAPMLVLCASAAGFTERSSRASPCGSGWGGRTSPATCRGRGATAARSACSSCWCRSRRSACSRWRGRAHGSALRSWSRAR